MYIKKDSKSGALTGKAKSKMTQKILKDERVYVLLEGQK